jgi:hypothetical protein
MIEAVRTSEMSVDPRRLYISVNLVDLEVVVVVVIIMFLYSSVEHRARVKVRHLVLFAAKASTSVQLFFCDFNTFSTVRRHVVLRRPLFLFPCGFHSSVAFVILLGDFLIACPIHFHFLL